MNFNSSIKENEIMYRVYYEYKRLKMLEQDTLQVLTKAEVKQLLQILNDAQSKQSIKKTEVHL